MPQKVADAAAAAAATASSNDDDANTDANSTDLDDSVTIGSVAIGANSPLDDLDQMSAASSISISTGGHERTAYIPLRSDFVRMLADLATHRHAEGTDTELSAEEMLNHAIRDLVQK